MKTVLVVSATTATWVRFKRKTIVASHIAPFGQLNNDNAQLCPWFNNKPSPVHLVLDCEQTEIDAHPLSELGSAWSYRSNKLAMQQRLLEQFPQSIVQTVPKKHKLGAVLVHHVNLDDHQREWLLTIESKGVVFRTVTTLTEIIAATLGKEDSAGCLVLYSTPEYIRHIYCRHGYALFTRVVERSNSKILCEQLEQTLGHLNNTSLVQQAMPVHTYGLSEDANTLLSSLDHVNDVTSVEISGLSEIDTNEVSEQTLAHFEFARKLLRNNLLSRNHANRKTRFLMEAFLRRQLGFKRALQNVIALSVLFASVGYAMSDEFRRDKARSLLLDRKNALSTGIERYKQEAEQLSPKAMALSKALLDKIAIESSMGVSPAILLTVVAEAFTQFRELELIDFQWVVIDQPTLAEDDQFLGNGGGVATSRQVLSSEGGIASVTRAVISGRVVNDTSLRKQLDVFNRFVAYLSSQDGIADFDVNKTPLKQSEGASYERRSDSAQWPLFEVQFDLVELAKHER